MVSEDVLPFLGVILTVRSAVFICGDTDAMVPCRMVPFLSSIVTVSLVHFIRNLFGKTTLRQQSSHLSLRK